VSSSEDEHAALADELTGLIRDVVMLHAPDVLRLCRGCNAQPWAEQESYVAYQQWPCPTFRLIRDGMGL
jgi:hypothetical protein